jgi:hypothetical protein
MAWKAGATGAAARIRDEHALHARHQYLHFYLIKR